jgi:hypothetical protein
MELGNMAFGCSRGKFPVERSEGWEEELTRLFDAYAPKRDNSWREYGEEFVNDVFEVHQYWWGDCTCGAECPIHLTNCDTETKMSYWLDSRIRACSGKPNKNGCVEIRLDKFDKWEKKNPSPKCTCGAEADWKPKDEHKETCALIRPNFLHKPTGYSLMWYKYPLRDSYANQDLTLKQFSKIIDNCIKSLTK